MPDPVLVAVACGAVLLLGAGVWRSAGSGEDRLGMLVLGCLGVPALVVVGVLGGLAAGTFPATVGLVGAAVMLPGTVRAFARREQRRQVGVALTLRAEAADGMERRAA